MLTELIALGASKSYPNFSILTKSEAQTTIEAAIEFAINSPDPNLDELHTDIWAETNTA